ncbi:vWA domain-containing protein [Candidatus Hecatella orcuttiae]|uniref:vWA domain-containing protein n=1 Tax=Candidatus Hecatella orcuttiae TaxID=1935119 RepID=UPI0028681038|nr:VWA domain-containing protein [Candidatus Hecatella orcuttiae]
MLIFSTLASAQFTLRTVSSTPPHLEVDKSVNPSKIWIKSLGFTPEKARITLTLRGVGDPAVQSFPIDVVLIVDRSASMAEGEKLEGARYAVSSFLKLLNPEIDRSSLVSFSSSARIDRKLTFNHMQVQEAIMGLSPEGATALGDAIHLANLELSSHGRPQAVLVEILLSDGAANIGSDPVRRAEEAADMGIVIYSIGLGVPTEESLSLLEHVAKLTGGKYYSAPDPANLEGIYREVAQQLSSLAGKNIVVKEVLPDYLNLEGDYTLEPVEVILNPDGTTTIFWDAGFLPIGDTWTVSFNVSSSQGGFLPADVYGETKVAYTDYKGEFASVIFPEVKILVRTVNHPPVADAGADMFVEQTTYQGAMVTLNGSSSFDPDGDSLTYIWTWDGNIVSGESPTVLLPLGETVVMLTVDDGVFSDTDTVKVTVHETTQFTAPLVYEQPSTSIREEVRGIDVESLFRVTFVPFYALFFREIILLSVLLLLVVLLVMMTRSQRIYDRYGEEYMKLLKQFMVHRILVKILYLLLVILAITLFILPILLAIF